MATLLPNGKQQFVDDNGAPLAGGSVTFYSPGTSVLKDTYQDAANSILNLNPLDLDAGGRAIIYGVGVYRQVVKDALGNIIWDQLTSDSSSAVSWAGVSTGTANAQIVAASGFSGQDGQAIDFIAGFTNTGPFSLLPNGVTPYVVKKDGVNGPASLAGGEIIAGNAYHAIYQAQAGIFHILPTMASIPVVTRAQLAVFDPTFSTIVILSEGNRTGIFVWKTGDYSENVYVDPLQGIFLQSNHVAATSGAWVRQFDGPVNVLWFGAIGNGSADDAPAVQCAINTSGGRAVYAPVGIYRMASGVSSVIPIHIFGDANGAGPGLGAQSNDNVTQFVADFANPVIFSVSSLQGSIFRDFGINVMPAHRPAGTGVGISLTAPGTATTAMSKIQNVEFQNIDGIQLNRAAYATIEGCYFDAWVQDAIRSATDMAIEASTGFISHNYFFGSFDGSQRSCIFLQNGYVMVTENEILGSQVGVLVNPHNFGSGYIRIFNNTIEEQYYYGVSILSTGNTPATMISVSDNEFSNVQNQLTYIASIFTDENGGTNFIQDLQICRNVTRHIVSAASKHIWIGNGQNVTIDGNVFEELGPNNPTLIQISGGTTNTALLGPIQIRDNVSKGSSNKYSIALVGVKLRDDQNLTYAQLPGNVVDGSYVWCADGKATSSSSAVLTGGGSGCPAWKVRNSWQTLPYLT